NENQANNKTADIECRRSAKDRFLQRDTFAVILAFTFNKTDNHHNQHHQNPRNHHLVHKRQVQKYWMSGPAVRRHFKIERYRDGSQYTPDRRIVRRFLPEKPEHEHGKDTGTYHPRIFLNILKYLSKIC